MERRMPALGKTAFKGASGQAYGFKVYPLGTRFRKLSGVYVVTTRSSSTNGGHRHVPLYVGQTEDLSQPLKEHRKADSFLEHGANCVCLLSDASAESRLAKKDDLIAAFHPVCND
jgi:hypothetical protein